MKSRKSTKGSWKITCWSSKLTYQPSVRAEHRRFYSGQGPAKAVSAVWVTLDHMLECWPNNCKQSLRKVMKRIPFMSLILPQDHRTSPRNKTFAKQHKSDDKKLCFLKTKSSKLTMKTTLTPVVSVAKVSITSIPKRTLVPRFKKKKEKKISSFVKSLNYSIPISWISVLLMKDWLIGLWKVWKEALLMKGGTTSASDSVSRSISSQYHKRSAKINLHRLSKAGKTGALI